MSAPEAIDGTYDPFEEFNRSVGVGVVEDPYRSSPWPGRRDRC